LGSEPDTGFTAVQGNFIVEQAADPVDVLGDRDWQQDFVRSDSRVDAINTTGVSAGRVASFRRYFASSNPLFPQLMAIFAPGSIPGSSTTERAVQDIAVQDI
jgi:hypothetical protein